VYPGEKVGIQHFGSVKPRVTAKDLVGAFTAQTNGIALFYLLAKVEKRGVYIRLPRQVAV
jgi:hypothetical protein